MIPYKLRKTSSVKREWSADELLSKCQKYCATAEHCTNDVKQLLTKYSAPEKTQDEIIDQLRKNNYLSDERYATAFVHDKMHFQHWGKIKIKQALVAKQIPSHLIDLAMNNINQSEYLGCLKELIEKKNIADEQKLQRFLYQRGFCYSELEEIRKE